MNAANYIKVLVPAMSGDAAIRQVDSTPIELCATGLFCERDDRVLFSDISLTLTNGQLLQLTGPNGAGKTTLMRILAGLNNDFS
ncbi:MAG: ATP-binding cassette domain-containing protein, partial [Oleibacter sp.]|nr:ATP-binding cassette domain-containing protein [Thalassolituus sp.]